jgi:hypothetical protein
VEVRVGDVALLPLLAAPVIRDPVAAAGLDVAVDAVVGEVQPAVREPLVEGSVRFVEGLRGLLGPVDQLLGLFRPETLQVLGASS